MSMYTTCMRIFMLSSLQLTMNIFGIEKKLHIVSAQLSKNLTRTVHVMAAKVILCLDQLNVQCRHWENTLQVAAL